MIIHCIRIYHNRQKLASDTMDTCPWFVCLGINAVTSPPVATHIMDRYRGSDTMDTGLWFVWSLEYLSCSITSMCNLFIIFFIFFFRKYGSMVPLFGRSSQECEVLSTGLQNALILMSTRPQCQFTVRVTTPRKYSTLCLYLWFSASLSYLRCISKGLGILEPCAKPIIL